MTRPTLAAATLALAFLVPSSVLGAQNSRAPQPIRPIDGSLVLAAEGDLHDAAVAVFVHLGGGYTADVVVVSSASKPRSVSRWKKAGARSVVVIGNDSASSQALTLAMLEADAVWFEDADEQLQADELFSALLHDVLARGGVVGGQGSDALALCNSSESAEAPGFGLLPRSRLQLGSKRSRGKSADKDESNAGRVLWQVPKKTALVLHHGRRVTALGAGEVIALVPASEHWPARRATISPADVFEYGDVPGYDLDLLSWLRSAQDHEGPAFPPAKPDKPSVSRGTLILSGGGSVQNETWKRFIEAAGGKKAKFVTIPSGAEIEPGAEPKSYGAGQLRDHGCTNVVVLHTSDPARANEDPALLALLEDATGIWIDGGRTYRFMDAFQYTRAHELIRDVLKRGGAVGGSSAGCQVLGDYLVRGDPRTNRTLTHEGYTKGLGLLPGVILDAHFLQRERHEAFAELVALHPQLLGIGVDADTSLVIEKSIAEVLGNESVSFYDAGAADPSPVILQKGQRYDLVKRRSLR